MLVTLGFLTAELWPFAPSAPAATMAWTNNAGGLWSDAANWDPHQPPGAGDTALITNSGTYTLALSYAQTLPAFVLVEGPTHSRFRFDASTNLTRWLALKTNRAPDGAWEFGDQNAPGFPQRFYRVRQP